MKHSRLFLLVGFLLCLLIVLSVPAAADSVTEDGTITIDSGIHGNTVNESTGEYYAINSLLQNFIPVFTETDPITFNLNEEFSHPTTTYSDTIARLSAAISMCMMGNNKYESYTDLVTKMGLNAPVYHWPGQDSFPNCATTYYISTSTIQRNGHDCTLILIAFREDTKGTYATMLSDLLLMDEFTAAEEAAGKTEEEIAQDKEKRYAAGDLYAITDAADFVYNYKNAFQKNYIPTDGSDYLFWLVGGLRGGSVANDLAAQLIDAYGTEHVVAYCIG